MSRFTLAINIESFTTDDNTYYIDKEVKFITNLQEGRKHSNIARIDGVDSNNRIVLVQKLVFKKRKNIEDSYEFLVTNPLKVRFNRDIRLMIRGVLKAIHYCNNVIYCNISEDTVGYDPHTKEYKMLDLSEGLWNNENETVTKSKKMFMDLYEMLIQLNIGNCTRSTEVNDFLQVISSGQLEDCRRIFNHPAIKDDEKWMQFLLQVLEAHFDKSHKFSLTNVSVHVLAVVRVWTTVVDRYRDLNAVRNYSKSNLTNKDLVDVLLFIKNFNNHVNDYIG
ncbi:hypothetical protein FRX31_011163, partial [Thalictrum thalictroides]